MNNSSRIELFVPGRLCLFGEHSDWAGANRAFNADILPGRAIVCGTQEGIYATAEKSELFSVDYALDNQEDVSFSCPMDAEALRLEAHTGKYYSYVAGVASYICEWYHVGGVKITITRRDLPLKKGLSSSAAICVLVAQAFNQLYNLNLSTLGVMNIAYMGEQRTPSRCGRLDQACAFGNVPVAMEFDGSEISAERISVKKPLYFVFADLNAKKDTVKILADLNSAYPFPRRDEDRKLHELLGADNRDITGRAVEYIKNGETEKLGALMTYAQQLFDEKAAPLCPEELTAPVLHSVLRDENIRSMTCGCKGVGSQGDGTAQFLAKDRENQLQLIQYLESRGMTAFALTIKPAQAVRKAIIPLAGFGTRMYPATRFIKKELCPVADSDGLVKPALLVLLEELDSAGIEEICLIINPGDRALYESLLFTPLSDRHYSSLPAQMQRYEQKYQRMIKKIRFAYQNEPRGFGHAVYQAAEFVGDDPVLLLLGDTIYKSGSGVPCTKQLLDAFEQYGKPVVAIQSVELERVGSYGVFAGAWENQQETVMRCSKIAEKPGIDYARDYLSVHTAAGDRVFGAFGCYVLTRKIFARLKTMIDSNIVNAKGEVELTGAIAWAAGEDEVFGLKVNGRSYDLGNANAYRLAVSEF